MTRRVWAANTHRVPRARAVRELPLDHSQAEPISTHREPSQLHVYPERHTTPPEHPPSEHVSSPHADVSQGSPSAD